jgi:hypothetical protein
VPVSGRCPSFTAAISQDSGTTWSLIQAPWRGGVESATPEAEFDSAGHLYGMWQDDNGTKWLARTDDLGKTWAGPWSLSPPGIHATAFDVLIAGGEGRLEAAFLGTTAQGTSESVDATARWDLFLLTIEDAETGHPGITSHRANPSRDPVQVGPICFGACPSRNHGDFMTGARSPDGRLYVALIDGCVGGCSTNPAATAGQSDAQLGFLATLDGWSPKGPA